MLRVWEEDTYTLSLARTVLGRRVDQTNKGIGAVGLDVDGAAIGLVEAARVLHVDPFAAVDAAVVVILYRLRVSDVLLRRRRRLTHKWEVHISLCVALCKEYVRRTEPSK